MSWQKLPRAPAPGTDVCPADFGTLYSANLDGFPVLVLRTASGTRAYFNACPHQFLPLDYRSRNVLSADGTRLRCSNHDAGFDAMTGEGVDGLGEGCTLTAIPVIERNGRLIISDA